MIVEVEVLVKSTMANIELKVVLLGKECCGKTSLAERFLSDRFAGENRYQNTIGAAFGAKTLEVEGRQVAVGVWDTAGSERYESMSRMYYRNAKAAIVCYAVNDFDSWDKVKFWVRELQKQEVGCRIYICCTKQDLIAKLGNKRLCVDYHNTTDFAEEIGAKVLVTSSKTGLNISELFTEIARDYLKEKAHALEQEEEYNIKLGKNKQKSGSCCAKN